MSIIEKILQESGLKDAPAPEQSTETQIENATNSNNVDNSGADNTSTGNTPDGGLPGPDSNSGGDAGQVADLDDAALLAALQKKGLNVKSIDELRSPAPAAEAPAAEKPADDVAEAARKYAIENNLVSKEKLDKYAQEKELEETEFARQLYRQQRLAELKAAGTADDDMPTADELDGEFEDAHLLYLPEDDPRRKQGEKHIKRMVKDYMTENYAEINGLEETYTRHQQGTQHRQSYDQALQESVKELSGGLTFKFKEGDQEHEYTFKPRPEMIAQLADMYKQDDTYGLFGQDKPVTKDTVLAAAKNSFLAGNLQEIIEEVSKAHAAKLVVQEGKGRRGIPITPGGNVKTSPTKATSTPIISGLISKQKT